MINYEINTHQLLHLRQFSTRRHLGRLSVRRVKSQED